MFITPSCTQFEPTHPYQQIACFCIIFKVQLSLIGKSQGIPMKLVPCDPWRPISKSGAFYFGRAPSESTVGPQNSSESVEVCRVGCSPVAPTCSPTIPKMLSPGPVGFKPYLTPPSLGNLLFSFQPLLLDAREALLTPGAILWQKKRPAVGPCVTL